MRLEVLICILNNVGFLDLWALQVWLLGDGSNSFLLGIGNFK